MSNPATANVLTIGNSTFTNNSASGNGGMFASRPIMTGMTMTSRFSAAAISSAPTGARKAQAYCG